MAIREFLHNDVSFTNQCKIKDIIVKKFGDNLEISRLVREKLRAEREERFRVEEENKKKEEDRIREENRVKKENEIVEEENKIVEEKIEKTD